jgi:hypothetical protein
MPKDQEYVGTYRVRKLSKGEQAIHVPVTVHGDYALYIAKDGTMYFTPIAGQP